MRIEHNQKIRLALEFQNQISRNEEIKRTKLTQKDEIQVGNEASEVQELVDILKRKELKRLEKVENTLKELENGTYKVSGRDVLLKILEERRYGFGNY